MECEATLPTVLSSYSTSPTCASGSASAGTCASDTPGATQLRGRIIVKKPGCYKAFVFGTSQHQSASSRPRSDIEPHASPLPSKGGTKPEQALSSASCRLPVHDLSLTSVGLPSCVLSMHVGGQAVVPTSPLACSPDANIESAVGGVVLSPLLRKRSIAQAWTCLCPIMTLMSTILLAVLCHLGSSLVSLLLVLLGMRALQSDLLGLMRMAHFSIQDLTLAHRLPCLRLLAMCHHLMCWLWTCPSRYARN